MILYRSDYQNGDKQLTFRNYSNRLKELFKYKLR